jgi:DNA-directed RNA polymerase I subunit RPA2
MLKIIGRRAQTLSQVRGQTDIPASLEVAHIPFSDGGAYPGLFLFTSASRFMRPVRQFDNAAAGAIELIGTLEQAYLDIKCPDGGIGGSVGLMPTHEETGPAAFLSAVASMTPWSDFNQSPRNMYQCQMAKQTMGTPLDSYLYRADTKLYRIHTPQRPISRTHGYDAFHVDDYPLGANAVVAVLSNTGCVLFLRCWALPSDASPCSYDMEDAMIINKASLDRGFGHGTLIKNETIDLAATARGAMLRFGRGASTSREKGLDDAAIGVDGLPVPGSIIKKGCALYSVVDETTGAEKLTKHKQEDPAIITQVTVLGSGVDRYPKMWLHIKSKNLTCCARRSIRKVNLQMLYNRNPITGDKFSSRHGQKGVLSFAWPDENMPFVSSTGMRPDIIINPHAFPSRMTIGMLVESLASKGGALGGRFVDATPFRASHVGAATCSPAETFGDALATHGFSRQGSETMISGTTGTVFQVDIFVGLVYYQRLRHMVSDKFQCRSVGPINQLTHQPVGGRKLGGGIRVGEMERDALLGHGAAYLLQDRLHLCSDRSVVNVCTSCGGMLAVSLGGKPGSSALTCKMCASSKCVERVALPHVLLFLASELAAMGIKLKIDISESCK